MSTNEKVKRRYETNLVLLTNDGRREILKQSEVRVLKKRVRNEEGSSLIWTISRGSDPILTANVDSFI